MSGGSTNRLESLLAVGEFLLKVVIFVLVVAVAWRLKDPLLERLGSGVQEVEAFGVRVSFVEAQLQQTLDEAASEGGERWQGASSAIPSLGRRLELMGKAVPGSRLLWVDEGHPFANRYERRILQTMGMAVDMATSNDQAMRLIALGCYDVVVAEMRQGGDKTAGSKLAAALHEGGGAPGVVIYLRDFHPEEGTPAYVHGITDRPTALIHLVLDVLERRIDDRCNPLGVPSAEAP